jgi:hypothetical protein
MSLWNNWENRDVISNVITTQPSSTSSFVTAPFDTWPQVPTNTPVMSETSSENLQGDLGLGTLTFQEIGLTDPEDSARGMLLPEYGDYDLGNGQESRRNPFRMGPMDATPHMYPSLPTSVHTRDLDVPHQDEDINALAARYRVMHDPVLVEPRTSLYPAQEDQENNPDECDMDRPTVGMTTCCCDCVCSQTDEQRRNAQVVKDIGVDCMKCCMCPAMFTIKATNKAYNWAYSF